MMLNTGEKWIIVNHEASVVTELRYCLGGEE
jgi:hypothetical protein